jgi:Rps23 Pro-64 3,4-dihydroxylase Tpa1-like proline 4-hydroxylase
MTPKQILDSFSETLMRDERILSPQERALVATLLLHAKSATSTNPELQSAVRAVIASAVGETVAQRAFGVLGSSIVERILDDATSLADSSRTVEVAADPQLPGRYMNAPAPPPSPSPGQPESPGVKFPGKGPQPPSHQPQHPGTKLPSNEPQHPGHKAPSQPQHPGTPLKTPGAPKGQPESPGGATTTTKVVAQTSVATAERPEILPAKCVVLDEFLSPQEMAELTRFTLEHEADFQASEVVSPTAESGVINYDHRRSRVLMDLGQQEDMMLSRIKAVLPQVFSQLGMEEFSIADVESQITASNDGDFFHFHNDNGSDRVASRHLTFVYFFHREPRQFEGGELRIHDSRLEEDQYVSDGTYQTIVPRQNQIVFFPCELMHEVTAVNCPSQAFADSRFTLNGWLRR